MSTIHREDNSLSYAFSNPTLAPDKPRGFEIRYGRAIIHDALDYVLDAYRGRFLQTVELFISRDSGIWVEELSKLQKSLPNSFSVTLCCDGETQAKIFYKVKPIERMYLDCRAELKLCHKPNVSTYRAALIVNDRSVVAERMDGEKIMLAGNNRNFAQAVRTEFFCAV